MNSSTIIFKVWSMCGVLYDDGVAYGDYLEQLTYMIFLKMADEYAKPPYNKPLDIPAGYAWEDLRSLRGAELEDQYHKTLDRLGKLPGILGQVFQRAQNKISEPAKLAKIISMIDAENWAAMSTDVKGEIYEGLLQKNAEDTKSGAGQYFTPRVLIEAMVECVQPEPMKTIVDPACGSGGFFLAAQRYISTHYKLDREQKEFLKDNTFRGWEIVPNTYRMSLMNLFLHNIGDLRGNVPITRNDALLSDPGERFDYVLSNPPFGRKSSMTFTNEEGEQEREDLVYARQDFWATTSNKQLNFLQHIHTLMKVGGEAAVVLPDNVLFEGGAGEVVRTKLMESCDVHTILRLPTGIFYRPGVKANVVFFQRMPASAERQTKDIWFYDLRTNKHFTLKQHPLTHDDLQDFITSYNPSNRHKRAETWSEENPDGRWRKFSADEVFARDDSSLDIFWIKDKALADLENLPEPEELAAEIVDSLESILDSFKELQAEALR
ncbi:class I SAM-dependent DNA methyltransferase [Alloscardovia sp. HMSC034E08]|uniref:class I SAM-dependent DNA methyltransferase n=1 Tax=Alloscardovia sp. HMSC034E08 TaxID=1739413 RepID=UPI0008CBCC0F|nr:class I SAM-dependent DNA methyltransferase [Alloscardovia sp. HMSC034E08]OFQ98620.1 DNA methyltransferase [Alloscardovia sp. HMSC034E08]